VVLDLVFARKVEEPVGAAVLVVVAQEVGLEQELLDPGLP